MDCIIQTIITKTYPTLKETAFNQLWKIVKGNSISDLCLPKTLLKEFEDYQNQEFLWLWNEVYGFSAFYGKINQYLEIETKTKTFRIDYNCLSDRVKTLIPFHEYELFVELSKAVSNNYKPRSYKGVQWLVQEEKYFDLLCTERFSDSDEDDPFKIYFISLQNPYSSLKQC